MTTASNGELPISQESGEWAGLAGLEAMPADAPAAFLWRPRDCSIPWANAAGLALWDAASTAQLAARRLDFAMPAIALLHRLALVLAPGASDQQAFVFWLPQGSRSLDCACLKTRLGVDDVLLLRVTPTARDDENAAGPQMPMPDLNGHAALPPASAGVAAPKLGAQDAATLAEIARMIRSNSAGTSARVAPGGYLADTGDAPSTASPELTANSAHMLGRLSHELRTPLNAIIGYGELLQSEQHGPLGDPKYRAYCGDILEAARHCLSLVTDLFEMTNLAAGDRQPEFSDVDVNAVVVSSLGIVAPIAAKAGVELTQDLGQDLPLAVIDKRGLRQILLNVIANAVKFTPAAGRVTIATGYCVGVGLFVVVSDTGAGMSGAGLDAARGGTIQGDARSGLGLPISRALAMASGGSLSVESLPGVGTKVTLFWPMTRLLLR